LKLAGIIRRARAPILAEWQLLLTNIRKRAAPISIEKRPLPLYKPTICNNLEYQKLKQQILRQRKDLAEAENTVKNLSTALAGLNVETEEATEKASILAGQLKEISLSLVIAREEEAVIIPRNECTICYLVISKIRDNTT
jgi:hypothetical protein